MREGEQKEEREGGRERRRKRKQEKESRPMKMKGRPRRREGSGHELPALDQQGLQDGLWRSPDVCLQAVKSNASPGRPETDGGPAADRIPQNRSLTARPPTHRGEKMPRGVTELSLRGSPGHLGSLKLMQHSGSPRTIHPPVRGGPLPSAPPWGLGLRHQWPRAHTYITTSRDMLNIVLGTTLGLNMAVAHLETIWTLEC